MGTWVTWKHNRSSWSQWSNINSRKQKPSLCVCVWLCGWTEYSLTPNIKKWSINHFFNHSVVNVTTVCSLTVLRRWHDLLCFKTISMFYVDLMYSKMSLKCPTALRPRMSVRVMSTAQATVAFIRSQRNSSEQVGSVGRQLEGCFFAINGLLSAPGHLST